MSANWQTVRVFISSTFRDMQAERDHLVRFVFPELRERIERLGLEFFDVDLRWGVPETGVDGERANSWEYCKRWIDEVEPLFVCMLGQRYGWRPPATEIPAGEDRDQYAGMSITEMEIRHAVLSDPLRKRSFFYLRSALVPESVPEDLYKQFVDRDDEDDLERMKEEISGCGRPVRDYDCRWTGEGFDQLEAFGHEVLEDLWSGVLRDARYVSPEVWREVLGHDPQEDPLYTEDSQPLPPDVWEKIVEQAKPAPKDPLDVESEQTAAFAASRLRWFQGRSKELGELRRFVQDTPAEASRLCVVRAAAGTGKSALLARLSQSLSDSPLLITHFVGATERSADARSLLERLVKELDRGGVPAPETDEGDETGDDLEGLRKRLASRLENYDGPRRLVLLIDALNQLTDGHSLSWLPARLGPNVRLIASCLDDSAAPADSPAVRVLSALQSRRTEPVWVDLSPLNEDDVREIVREYLHEYCKELDVAQVQAICDMEQARNPLYLRVMLDVLRSLGGNDMHLQVRDLISEMPARHPDTVSLFNWVLERLDVFGEEAVGLWCSYLALGRVGMSNRELSDLLSRKLSKGADRIALLIERGLRRYLQRRGAQFDFFHGALRQAAEQRYLPDHPTALHADIAGYMETRWREPDRHALSELPYHQTEGELWEKLVPTLTDLLFVEAKCGAEMTFHLVADYNAALAAECLQPTLRESVAPFARFVRANAHIFARGDEWVLQRAYNSAASGPVAEAAERLLQDAAYMDRPWLRRLQRLPTPARAYRQVLEGHSSWVRAVALAPDGRRAVSGSDDTTLRVWDLETGECKRTLQGHANKVSAIALTPDGRRAVSGSDDTTLRVWDLETGECKQTLQGHKEGITAVAITPDGRRALSGSKGDHWNLKVWDLETGECTQTLFGHWVGVTAVALTQDGRRAVSGSKHIEPLGVWDMETGECTQTLIGQFWEEFTAVAITQDGRLAVSGSAEMHGSGHNTVRVWDLETGECTLSLVGHVAGVTSIALTHDGGRAMSASADGALCVWDLRTGECIQTLIGHVGAVTAVALTPDGRRAVTGIRDSLWVWDLEHGRGKPTPAGHARTHTTVALTHDGRRAVGWSNDLPLPDRRRIEDVLGRRSDAWGGGNAFHVWDLQTGERIQTVQRGVELVLSVLLTPDGRRAVSWSYGSNTLHVWDVATGQCTQILKGHAGSSVCAVALTPDGRWAVSGGWDAGMHSSVYVWDLVRGECTQTLEGHWERIEAIALTPDGHRVVSASGDNSLRVWDLETGECTQTLIGHVGAVTAVALTPDGRRAVTGGGHGDHTVRVWDLATGDCMQTLEGHTGSVGAVALTPDGRRAVTGTGGLLDSGDKTLRVWDLEVGECKHTLEGHTMDIVAVALTPDGRRVWSAGLDQTLRVWDLETGEEVAHFAEGDFITSGDVLVGNAIAMKDGSGVYYLKLEHVADGPDILTAWRSSHDLSVSFGCLRCRVWSEVPESALGTELPCPNCGKPIRLNPFVIEADWRPVAAAWRTAT